MTLLVPRDATLNLPGPRLHSAEHPPIAEPHKELCLSFFAAQRCQGCQGAWVRRNTAERGRAGNWRVSKSPCASDELEFLWHSRPLAAKCTAHHSRGPQHKGLETLQGSSVHLKPSPMCHIAPPASCQDAALSSAP